MLRITYIEQIRRQIYNGQPQNDATITVGLVNTWLNQAIGVAARKNYTDNLNLEGIGYVNNSFYSRFTGVNITKDSVNLWKLTLPQIPIGIGKNEGVSALELVDTNGEVSRPFVALSENQRTLYKDMMAVPNKILYYYEGKVVYMISTVSLNFYTANVTMISGGLSTDLYSELNVPDDYLPVVTEYLKQQLQFERLQPVDATPDGLDAIQTT